MLRRLREIFEQKNTVNILIASVIGVVIIAALFSGKEVRHAAGEALHEIKTFDAWSPSALTGPGAYPCPRSYMTPVAFYNAPAIAWGDSSPQLVKELGIEVVPIVGGKVKITGVMGNSWADRAGLKRDDIILRFNKKKIKDMDYFKTLINKAAPEKDYRIKILRGGRIKSTRVTVGEGEMEGFTPIVPAAYMNPAGLGLQGMGFYQCRRCGNSLIAGGTSAGLSCPVCNFPMCRMK
jgi:hypothetical protein